MNNRNVLIFQKIQKKGPGGPLKKNEWRPVQWTARFDRGRTSMAARFQQIIYTG